MFPVLLFPAEKLRYRYRAGGVPQVIVPDHQGRVIYTRPGELGDSEELDSVFAAAVRHSDTEVMRTDWESKKTETTSR
jgi:thioredoxin-related protein